MIGYINHIKADIKSSHDTNLTHYFENSSLEWFQSCSTIEWE